MRFAGQRARRFCHETRHLTWSISSHQTCWLSDANPSGVTYAQVPIEIRRRSLYMRGPHVSTPLRRILFRSQCDRLVSRSATWLVLPRADPGNQTAARVDVRDAERRSPLTGGNSSTVGAPSTIYSWLRRVLWCSAMSSHHLKKKKNFHSISIASSYVCIRDCAEDPPSYRTGPTDSPPNNARYLRGVSDDTRLPRPMTLTAKDWSADTAYKCIYTFQYISSGSIPTITVKMKGSREPGG